MTDIDEEQKEYYRLCSTESSQMSTISITQTDILIGSRSEEKKEDKKITSPNDQ